MDIQENNDMFDLGSAPIDENFDPFAAEEEPEGITNDDLPMQQPDENEPASSQAEEQPAADTPANATEAVNAPNAPKAKTAKTEQDFALGEKLPVFVYAGATENISDTSMTFDELRIEKSGDFLELDDGKRVSWTVEYGKVTKAVPDPKGSASSAIRSIDSSGIPKRRVIFSVFAAKASSYSMFTAAFFSAEIKLLLRVASKDKV